MLADQEPLIIKQFLLDLEYDEDPLDSILSGDKERDSGGNHIDDGDRVSVSISNSGDNKDDDL